MDEELVPVLQLLKEELNNIHERNARVELDKAWETSRTRIACVVAITYILMCIVFYLLGVVNWATNALIPTIGYFLSTQSLPFIKRWWIGWHVNNRKE